MSWLPEAEQLQILAQAGISAEDIDLVVQNRLREHRTSARKAAETLRAAGNALTYADVGVDVPESERWGKGAKVTDTDERGAWRTLAAAIARAEFIADTVATTEEAAQKRREVLGGMCRREAEGKHDDNLRLIEWARPHRGSTGSAR